MAADCQHPRALVQDPQANDGVQVQCLECGAVKLRDLWQPWSAPRPMTQASQWRLNPRKTKR